MYSDGSNIAINDTTRQDISSTKAPPPKLLQQHLDDVAIDTSRHEICCRPYSNTTQNRKVQQNTTQQGTNQESTSLKLLATGFMLADPTSPEISSIAAMTNDKRHVELRVK